MGNLHIVVCFCLVTFLCQGQVADTTLYGEAFDRSQLEEAAPIFKGMEENVPKEAVLKGRVLEVCQVKGCWMKLQLTNDETLMVKFKDYGFFVPNTLVGATVIIGGKASIVERSVEEQRHYAEDAGASKERIASITTPKHSLHFEASGVYTLDSE